MKNISYTKIAIWAILFITAKMYLYDLPIVFKTMVNIERAGMATDSIQTLMIGKLVDSNNKIVEVCNGLKTIKNNHDNRN